jgi:class 3 adenylate cyclase
MVRRRGDERGLATLLFTDIVGSSDVAVELGDRRWRSLQARHHAEVRKQLKRHGGHEVDTAGDGFFATFASPAAGVRCAFAIVQEVRELGLDVRAGVHIGEVDLTGEKVGGIAVTTAQRVETAAGPGQVWATDTIVHLVAGSGLEFTDLGSRELKGVPGRWELFSLDAVEGESIGPPLDPKDARTKWDRWSPAEAPRRRPLRVLLPAIAGLIILASAGAAAMLRNDPGTTITLPSRPAPEAVAALRDGTGEVAFPVDLPLPGARFANGTGPILLTGRLNTPKAFVWLPWGFPGCCLWLAQINRAIGSVIDASNEQLFRTNSATCVCVASAEDRIWTPMTGKGEPNTGLPHPTGLSLHGVGLTNPDETDIPVAQARVSFAVTTLVSGAGYLWVGVSSPDRIYRVDPTGPAVKMIGLRQSPDLMIFADGSLWVLDRLGGKLTRVDRRDRSHPSFPISGNIRGMAVGGGFVWVTDADGNQIWQVPEDLGSPATPIPVEQIGISPSAITYDDGMLVVGFTDGTVAKINPNDPTSPAVIWTHRVGSNATSISVDHGIVWVGGQPAAS